MKLYVVRHGLSLGNVGEATTPNCGLTEQGFKQAAFVGDFFEHIAVDAIYSSPITRAVQTASPLAQSKGKSIILEPRMCEFFHELAEDHRDYEWEKLSEIKEFLLMTHMQKGYEDKWWPVWPEVKSDVHARVAEFYYDLLDRYMETDLTVVVFGHGATTGELKGLVNKETMNPCPNAAIFYYELNDEGVCMDHQMHLEHLGDYATGLNDQTY